MSIKKLSETINYRVIDNEPIWSRRLDGNETMGNNTNVLMGIIYSIEKHLLGEDLVKWVENLPFVTYDNVDISKLFNKRKEVINELNDYFIKTIKEEKPTKFVHKGVMDSELEQRIYEGAFIDDFDHENKKFGYTSSKNSFDGFEMNFIAKFKNKEVTLLNVHFSAEEIENYSHLGIFQGKWDYQAWNLIISKIKSFLSKIKKS